MNKKVEHPFVIIIMSIVSILLGFSGMARLNNNDILIGVPLVILGFIGGILGLRQYRVIKTQTTNDSRKNHK